MRRPASARLMPDLMLHQFAPARQSHTRSARLVPERTQEHQSRGLRAIYLPQRDDIGELVAVLSPPRSGELPHGWRMKTSADLNHLQTGRYGEYFAKMAFARAGFDVFNAEVDDKGIDFVLPVDGDVARYYDVQVKTVRSRNTYVFMRKDNFRLTSNLLLALVILDAGSEPDMYLIPASAWRHAKPPFADRNYDGLKSAPEYGLTVSPSAMVALEEFRFTGSIPA
jgi:hypothetical protein